MSSDIRNGPHFFISLSFDWSAQKLLTLDSLSTKRSEFRSASMWKCQSLLSRVWALTRQDRVYCNEPVMSGDTSAVDDARSFYLYMKRWHECSGVPFIKRNEQMRNNVFSNSTSIWRRELNVVVFAGQCDEMKCDGSTAPAAVNDTSARLIAGVSSTLPPHIQTREMSVFVSFLIRTLCPPHVKLVLTSEKSFL